MAKRSNRNNKEVVKSKDMAKSWKALILNHIKNTYWMIFFHKYLKQDNKCYFCWKEFEKVEDITLDHLTPIWKWGKTEEWNICLACKKCNNEKWMLTEQEYKAVRALRKKWVWWVMNLILKIFK